MCFENGKLTKDTVLKAGFAMRNQIEDYIAGKEVYDTKGQKVLRFYFNSNGILFYEKEKTILNPRTVLSNIANTKNGSSELDKLLDESYFDFPKPTKLLKYLIQLVTSPDSVILDFFSGSATAAHAVMQLNAEDGGKRKFILVQLPEDLDDSLRTANKDNKKTIENTIQFLDTINKPHILTELGKERIRRAAKKIHEDNPDVVFDDGFKVFKTADTTIRWNKLNDNDLLEFEKVSANTDNDRIDFTDGYNDIDVVYEIMLRHHNIPLSTPIEKLDEIGERTYMFADSVLVCLEREITDELIKKLAAIEPTPAKFILRDSAFGDDIEFKDVSFRRLSALIQNHQSDEEKKSKYSNYTVEFI